MKRIEPKELTNFEEIKQRINEKKFLHFKFDKMDREPSEIAKEVEAMREAIEGRDFEKIRTIISSNGWKIYLLEED